jgi:hypothetical protein
LNIRDYFLDVIFSQIFGFLLTLTNPPKAAFKPILNGFHFFPQRKGQPANISVGVLCPPTNYRIESRPNGLKATTTLFPQIDDAAAL